MRRLLGIVVVCASLSFSAAAQRAGFAGHFGGARFGGASPAHFTGGSPAHFSGSSPGHFRGGPAGTGFHHGFHHHGFGFPGQGSLISLEPFFGFGTPFGFDGGFFPFFPWFFAEDWQPDAPPAPASPQVIVVREGAPPYEMPVAGAPPSRAKVIEVPGSRDVAQEKPEAPATLVLRDGKEISVSRYTIMGQYLYDSSRPRHTTRIPLDQLDLEATQRLNAQHGVPFELPADNNEVMVRF